MGRKTLNLQDKRFGALLVLEPAPRSPRNQTQWRCACDCGNETVVTTGNLRSGNTRSCGCLKGGKKTKPTQPVPPVPDWLQ